MEPNDTARNKMTAAEISRLEDATINPLTGTEWPAGHNNLLQARRQLPVRDRCQDILDTYHQNKAFVLSSGTGSGKSTQIPQFLVYDELPSKLKIACTQPRRIAATSVARRVAQEMGVTLGQEVGFQIGGEVMVDRKKTRLAYMTEGVLLGKLSSDEKLSEYACVIIDEAHERTVQGDMLLALLKKALSMRKDFKVVIMSATVDARLFQDYFDNCPLVHIEGRNFDVKVHHTGDVEATTDYAIAASNVALDIHRKGKPGNILIFLPGAREIAQVCGHLNQHAQDLDAFPLYGNLPGGKQTLALDSDTGRRKCIVSTNVAETSLTIDGIVYVIDCGLSRQMIYDPRNDMEMLDLRAISKASANQRKGRAGRTQDGVCFRLYSKKDYENMEESTEPSIRCSPVHQPMLKLVSMGYVKPLNFDWIDHPHPESVIRACHDLQNWGFIQEDGDVSDSGLLAAEFPLDPIWFRAIQEGAKLGCAQDIVDIAVVCSSQKPIFLHPEGFRDLSNVILTKDAPVPSDHIRMANVFNAWMRAREVGRQENGPDFSLERWCGMFFLDMAALEEIRKSRNAIGKFLQFTAKIPPSRAMASESEKVRKALAIAFSANTAMHCGKKGDQYSVALAGVGHLSGLLEPTSCLVSEIAKVSEGHQWIVYTNLERHGAKTYMKMATAINVEWLVDLPAFQDENLPKRYDGSLCKPDLKEALDAARARIAASKST